mmetsp:Transcript_23316/g.59065  ORF Transcript_23316/g.59065 Transcript_23316/m.59065 type:complete len:90 (+) Transcript_23316:405-674(+)
MASFSLQPHTRTMCKQLSDPQGASNDHLGYGGVALSADGLVLAAASYKDDTKVDNGGSVLVGDRRIVVHLLLISRFRILHRPSCSMPRV